MININGINVSCVESGKGKPIILIHGWGQSSAFWSKLTAKLSQKYNVFAIDLPGFGLSDEPHNIWRVEDYADFLHKFVLYKNINNPIIIGHSFGGRIAAIYSSKYPCSKLVLYSSSGLPNRDFGKKVIYIFTKVLGLLFPNLVYKLHCAMCKPQDYKNQVLINKERSQIMLNIYCASQLKDSNLTNTFSKIKTPTLLIYGQNDFVVKLSIGKKIHKLVKNSELVIVEKAAHFSHIEKPDFFLEKLIYFLKS